MPHIVDPLNTPAWANTTTYACRRPQRPCAGRRLCMVLPAMVIVIDNPETKQEYDNPPSQEPWSPSRRLQMVSVARSEANWRTDELPVVTTNRYYAAATARSHGAFSMPPNVKAVNQSSVLYRFVL